MPFKGSIPARPSLDNSRCTCVWPEEYTRQAVVVERYQAEQDRIDIISSPLTSLGTAAQTFMDQMPGGLAQSGTPLDTPLPMPEQKLQYPSFTSSDRLHPSHARSSEKGEANVSPGGLPDGQSESEAKKRLAAKSSHFVSRYSESKVKVAPARALKLAFKFTSQMKLRNLLAYREDLVIILRMIIPSYQQTRTTAPIAKRDTTLCSHCLTILAHALYHLPIRYDSYLREGSTRALLALLDDAVASLRNQVRMEVIGHREAEHILRGELAVTEWRMATKYAALHKRTGIADLFPMKVGQFAELFVSADDPAPLKSEGVFMRGGKAAAKMVGLVGSDAGPAKQMAQSSAVDAAAAALR